MCLFNRVNMAYPRRKVKNLILFIFSMLLTSGITFLLTSYATVESEIRYTGEHYIRDVNTCNTLFKMNNTCNSTTCEQKFDLSMDLYLRMTTVVPTLPRYYETLLVQSMRYFWPDNFSMVVVLDYERHEDHLFAETIRQTFPFPSICFMDPITGIKFSGRDRMQRDMFYPERCTSKKYVGYLDTDTVFISRIIPEMLFDEGKPIIIGLYGNITTPDWGMMAETTANIFQTKEVMSCMANFPVIIKVDHIIKLRKYLEKLHNMPLEEILQTKKNGYFCQFCLMCQYIWLFHRDEYKFHLSFNPNGNDRTLPGRESHEYYKKTLTRVQLTPIARSCLHYKYHDVDGVDWKNQLTYTNVFKSSICFMGGFDLCPDKCKTFRKDSLRKEMFVFDHVDWTWDKRCLVAQTKHYEQVAKYASLEYSNIIRNACNEVDTLKWEP